MEERKCEEMSQTTVSKIAAATPKKANEPIWSSNKDETVELSESCMGERKCEVISQKTLDSGIAAATPEKVNEPVGYSRRDETADLPESYKVIAGLFRHMIRSLRLLALRKKSPTFGNISRQVELLAGRKFSSKQLSQIKHILPEVVHTDKILVYDNNTLCMKPDIKITLMFDIIKDHQKQSPCDVVEDHQEQSRYITLQHLFTSRLLNMSTKLPTVYEIPEAEMPEPFNQRTSSIKIDALPEDLSTEYSASQPVLLVNSTHLDPCFNRSFSKKMAEEIEEKTPLLSSQIHTTSSSYTCSTDQGIASASRTTSLLIPVSRARSSSSVTSSACETTPLKVAVETGDLTLQTPAQFTPKRSVPSCDNKLKTMTNQTVTPYSAKKSLDFFAMEDEENASESTSDEIDSLKFVDQTTAKQRILEEDNISNTALVLGKGEKGRCTSKDLSINRSMVSPQQMAAGLSDLIAFIHQTFQSVSCPAITKDELIYKIMINSFDIVERREVEEQIGLLEKLVPDWICSKLVPSGDVLYNIKKQSDLNLVCRMLHEQVTKRPKETAS